MAIEEVDRDSQNYLVSMRIYDRTTGKIEPHQANCDGCGIEQRVGYIAAAEVGKHGGKFELTGTSAEQIRSVPGDSSGSSGPFHLPQKYLWRSPDYS